MNLNVPADKQSAEYQKTLVKTARTNLWVALAFTVLNVVMILTGSNQYFLFSMTLPYYLTFFGYVFDYLTVGTYTLTGLTLAVVPVLALALCAYMSKRSSRWLVGSTVVFGLDTVAMLALLLWSGDVGAMVVDIIFHGWVLFCLVRGIRADGRLKELEALARRMEEEAAQMNEYRGYPVWPGDEEYEAEDFEEIPADTDCPV